MAFYCERAAGYCADIGYQEDGFCNALVRMFEQALKSAKSLTTDGRDSLIARLNRVREISHTSAELARACDRNIGTKQDFLSDA